MEGNVGNCMTDNSVTLNTAFIISDDYSLVGRDYSSMFGIDSD